MLTRIHPSSFPSALTASRKLPARAKARPVMTAGRDRLQFGFAATETQGAKLYPAIEPYETRMLKVSDIHTLYVEESGNPNGYPVVVLHGGPGGGSKPLWRQFFDPSFYRIIQFDQRGCGKSVPSVADDLPNALKENTTWDLVEDIEKIRKHLNIDQWLVMGGSWGTTLGLAYTKTHPGRVSGQILRSVFLGRKKDIDWLYQDGASRIQPESWQDYLSPVPEEERDDMVKAYRKLLNHPDENVRLRAAKAWGIWEMVASYLKRDEESIKEFEDPRRALPFASIENHYFGNGLFLRNENQLLEDIGKISHIPTYIIHGRYDLVCPIDQAVALKEAIPNAKLYIAPTSGHSAKEPGIKEGIVEASDAFKAILKPADATQPETGQGHTPPVEKQGILRRALSLLLAPFRWLKALFSGEANSRQ